MQEPWTLVTGASGFLGSALVCKLVERGVRVKAFVRAGANLKPLEGLPADRFQLAMGDIMVEHTVYRALAGCQWLYHVASVMKLWDRDPKRIIGPSVDGTRSVLRAARQRNLKRIVVTSSTAVLGATADPSEMDETHAFNLSDPETYIRAKCQADEVVEEFLREGTPIVRVLPATLVGPGDVKPTPAGQLVVRYLKANPNFKFPVFAGGINLVDVEDVAEGHILAMTRGRTAQRYILGGENLTYQKAFESLSNLTGLAQPTEPLGPGLAQLLGKFFELKARWRGGDPMITTRTARDYVGKYVWVTSAKAQQELGYQHRSAREALGRAARWFLSRGYVPESLAERVRLELRPA